MPKVSILIPVYNDEIFIEDLLNSILNQTFQNFECLIYNHGSTDNSQKILENFSNKDKRIKIFVTQQNIGNGANNKLLQHATGEYIKFFCADDIMLPNCLEKQVSFFEDKKNNKYSVLLSKVIEINNKGVEFNRNKNTYVNKSWDEHLNYIFYRCNPEFSFPTVMIRKSAICDNMNLFDERFAQLNDVVLWINLFFQKKEFYVLNDFLIKYRKHDNNISNLNSIKKRARLIFEYQRILEFYLININTFDNLLKIFPEAQDYLENLNENDLDLIPFIICQLALKINCRLNPYIEVHKNFAINQLFNILQNNNIAQKIYEKFNFTYSDFKNLTLNNPNGLDIAHLYKSKNLDYTSLKKRKGLFRFIYTIRKKIIKIRIKNMQKFF
jgi:glycosyltransferase involved in cell wall biosynthesis